MHYRLPFTVPPISREPKDTRRVRSAFAPSRGNSLTILLSDAFASLAREAAPDPSATMRSIGRIEGKAFGRETVRLDFLMTERRKPHANAFFQQRMKQLRSLTKDARFALLSLPRNPLYRINRDADSIEQSGVHSIANNRASLSAWKWKGTEETELTDDG